MGNLMSTCTRPSIDESPTACYLFSQPPIALTICETLHTIGDDPETIRTLCALKLVFKDERMRAVVSDFLNPFKEALTQRKQFYRVVQKYLGEVHEIQENFVWTPETMNKYDAQVFVVKRLFEYMIEHKSTLFKKECAMLYYVCHQKIDNMIVEDDKQVDPQLSSHLHEYKKKLTMPSSSC